MTAASLTAISEMEESFLSLETRRLQRYKEHKRGPQVSLETRSGIIQQVSC